MSIADKRRAFRALHQSGCFVIPNPWNVGSARYMQGLGFKALATTSSGYAHSIGYADGDVTRDMMLAHYREIAHATNIPLNADFEGGYADDPDEVAANVRLCIDTGVAGLSIEDFTGDESNPLYDFDLAVKRVRATRDAIDKAGGDVVFTARTEGFIHNRPDLDETIRRLKAFADAGADCLYSPGIKTREQIEATIKAVAPKPINFLNQRCVRLHRQRPCGARRAPHQRRRHDGAGRHARFHPIGPADRARRQVRQLRGCRDECRVEQVLPRRPAAPSEVVSDPQRHPATGQPIGAPVDDRPAPRPAQ